MQEAKALQSLCLNAKQAIVSNNIQQEQIRQGQGQGTGTRKV
jgi:hypothetical protein